MAVLVGRKAPKFNAQAVVNGGEFVENYTLEQFEGNKYVVLLSLFLINSFRISLRGGSPVLSP